MMWAHPYQARVSTMEEVIKQLTPLTSTGPNWPYTLVQLNWDACHVLLPTEGHLSIMVKGSTSSVPYGRVNQLEVSQLLSSGLQVVYSMGLNGCQVPLIVSLPESLAQGANMLGGEPASLPVDILQSIAKGQEPKAPLISGHSTPILTTSSIRAHPPKAEGQDSIAMEVRELLSWAALDTSGHTSGGSTPKRLEPIVLVTPLPPKQEDFARPVDTSSQVSTPDDAEMEDPSLEEIPATSSPTARTPGPSSDAPPLDVAHLQEEANKALGDLLVTKSLIDAHWQKLVSDFGMTLWQNRSQTLESIKEAKAHCMYSIKEAEAHCSLAIWEVESWGSAQACSIQQSHAEDVQHLKEESLEEERRDQLNFLSTCQAALKASPPKFHGMLIAPYHLLLGHVPMSNLFTIPPGASLSQQGSTPGVPPPSAPIVPGPLPRPKQQHHSPDPAGSLPPSKTTSKVTHKGPPFLKWWEVTPLYKMLTRSHQEAFGQDPHLVRKARGRSTTRTTT